MSKIIELLNRVTHQKTKEYSSAPNKRAPKQQGYVKETTPPRKNLIMPISIIILLAVLGLNLKAFFAVRNYAAERDYILATLNETEELVNKNTKLVNAFSTEIKRISADLEVVNLRIQNSNEKRIQLEKDNKAQSAAIENLIKSNNALLNKINALEAQLNKSK